MAEMGTEAKLVHAVFVPFPQPGHVTPMLQLAKFLNSKGLHTTFLNTEHNHRLMLKSRGPDTFKGTSSFKFDTYPDGLPPSKDPDAPRDNDSLIASLYVNGHEPLIRVQKLNEASSMSKSPPVTLIIFDVFFPFSVRTIQQLGDIPVATFSPYPAATLLACSQFGTICDKGILPLKDLTTESLDVELDLMPSMKGIRSKDLPLCVRVTEKNNPVFHYLRNKVASCVGLPLICNTFKALERDLLEDLSSVTTGTIYTLGPLHRWQDNSQQNHTNDGSEVGSVGCSPWKEDPHCLGWLDSKGPNSVIYVSFGTSTFMTNEQLIEFAWGLANSKYSFLWVLRPGIVTDGSTNLPQEFLNEVKDRGLLVSWCAQEMVLNHKSIGSYLMHSGWNSTLESICSGVPIICWPSVGDQQTNCWLACNKLGIGMGICDVINRADVEKQLREVMEGEKGKEMKKKVMEWKVLAEEATSSKGSSTTDANMFINYAASLVGKRKSATKSEDA